MTKEELRDKILDEFISDYYASNLCQMIDGYEFISNISSSKAEDAVFELLDDLSYSVIETMETEGVLKEKKEIPV